MQLDPPIRLAPKFPFTSILALAAIILSIVNWNFYSLDALIATTDNALTAPWTLLTATLLHGSILHLFFNLMWWWPLGARIEYAWGTKNLVLITLLLAVVSGAAQAAFMGPGIGLSGVIYGLFAMLYAAHGSHPIFRGIINKSTVQLMVGWFFICIVLEYLNIFPPIGHVAHGVGALAGYILGRCIVAARLKRTPWIAALAAVTIAATVAFATRNHWPASFNTAGTYARRAAAAYDRQDFQAAAQLYEEARRAQGADEDAYILVQLAFSYLQLGRADDALPLLAKAAALDPENREAVAPTISLILFKKALAAYQANDFPTAHEFAKEALNWQPAPEIRELISATRQPSSDGPAETPPAPSPPAEPRP